MNESTAQDEVAAITADRPQTDTVLALIFAGPSKVQRADGIASASKRSPSTSQSRTTVHWGATNLQDPVDEENEKVCPQAVASPGAAAS